MRFFWKWFFPVFLSLFLFVPAFALDGDVSGTSFDSFLTEDSEVDFSLPDDSFLEDVGQEDDIIPVSVDVSGTDEPVTVVQEETEKQIVLNVTVTPPSVDVKSESPVVNVEAPVVNVDVPAPVVASAVLQDIVESSDSIQEESEPVPVFIPYRSLSLSPDASHSDSSSDSIRSVLENLLGEYQPKIQTVTEFLSDGTENTYEEYVPGLPGMDWTWLGSLALLAIMIFCLFRLLGSVIIRG